MNITETIIVIICCAILGIVGIPYILTIIIAPFYFKFGIGKWFLHDIMHWHLPDETSSFDGCSIHSYCKFCNKEIMQDSQGNWFTFN